MNTDLITRTRAGEGDAFRALTEPHRNELQVHCYRMLGALQDAEDALQDTMLAAWQGLAAFESRSSVRTFGIYRQRDKARQAQGFQARGFIVLPWPTARSAP
ncbi:hypothetical protein Rhe02_33950 [Rhizocola hellebori]|uniref:RNA polymerase sigma-70 region 2 domain-containing protein n=1 Tax=Rhizocola hellebori TaxID=1392758 RepID=A0A8J3Q767_9ACTN|nr:sigma factor [Rhizocola hellebori]GIH05328.1 hypothetical protein Rhe02_33950 [Rhizocola hellebori]